MRREMREEQIALKEQQRIVMSERAKAADRLIEKWMKNESIDSIRNLADSNVEKARALAFMLENQENHLASLTETQISNDFKTTPENVIRIIRLAWPNQVRGEIFYDWSMETARDSMYYLHPVTGKTLRGATAGGHVLETSEYRYPTEVEIEAMELDSGAYKATAQNAPLRPFTVKILVDGVPMATDDGNGNIIGTGISGTVAYDTGVTAVAFTTAPAAGSTVDLAYNYDSEVASNYDNIGSVELQLKDYQFRVKPRPLYVSWSKMTEILLGSTLGIDAEEALIRGVADEFKKAQDFQAVAVAWGVAKGHAATPFNCQGATGEPEVDRMAAFSKAIKLAGSTIYDQLLRGGITKMVAGPQAAAQLYIHPRFDASNRQPEVGIFRTGSVDGVDVYQAPSAIVPTDEILCVYKNEQVPEDVSIAFGTFIPLYRTQTLEYKEMYKESGLATFGDYKVLNPQYLQRIKLLNMGNL